MRGFALAVAGTCSIALAGVATPARAQVQLPHKNLSYSAACPGFQHVQCAPDGDPRRLIFNLVPPVLEVVRGHPVYANLLGRTFDQPYTQGAVGRNCGSVASPFTNSHFDYGSATSPLTYNFTLESTLTVGAEVDLVQALVRAGLPSQLTAQVSAAAHASFTRNRNRIVSTTGRLLIARLKTSVIDQIRFGTGRNALTRCGAFLVANPRKALIKAMSVFYIRRSSAGTSIDQAIIADIQAILRGTSAEHIASVNVALNSHVRSLISSELSDRYIVWAVTWLRPEDH